jgi:hypothetical protein
VTGERTGIEPLQRDPLLRVLATVTVANIVLATVSKQLRMSLQAEAAACTPPVAGSATWAASDVSRAAASWTNASGAAGTLFLLTIVVKTTILRGDGRDRRA